MPFFSLWFLFFFLPGSVAFHFIAARLGGQLRLFAMIAVSFLLLGLLDIRAAALLAVSVAVNYAIASLIEQARDDQREILTRVLLTTGIGINLGTLAIFRYGEWLVRQTGPLPGIDFDIERLLVPIGLLFYACDQIAFLIDVQAGKHRMPDFLRYVAFVSFFPRLAAGPLLRFEQIAPWLETPRVTSEDLAAGLSQFAIGLAKTVLLGGAVAPFASMVFGAAENGESIGMFLAWAGVLAFACQIYFDLSGYTDMAIGIGRCFGIRLPTNFRSPYRALNIAEFWRRWNITLSEFLKDYIYRPLGGNKSGAVRSAFNLVTATVLAGMWYGAGRMFIAWGLLHAFFLIVHRIWRTLAANKRPFVQFQATKGAQVLSIVATFLAVTLAWIVFHAPHPDAIIRIFSALAGQYGAELPSSFSPYMPGAESLGIVFGPADAELFWHAWLSIALCLAVIFACPDTETLLSSFHEKRGGEEMPLKLWPLRWTSSPLFAIAVGVLLFASIASPNEALPQFHWRF